MSSRNYKYVKQHKERLLEPGNEVALAEFIKKKQEADKRYRQKKLNSENAAEFKKLKSKQAMESRRKKALKDLNEKEAFGCKYKSKNGLSKAVNKLEKNLPKEKAKQIEVMEVMADHLDMRLKPEKERTNISRQRHYYRDIPDLVKDFYLMDSVSRQLPGKKDFIIIKLESGMKEKYQKRVMLTTVEEAYLEFIALHPQQKLCKSKFFELRPKFVLLLSQTPHNVCCCIYCSNFEFLFEALKPFLNEKYASYDDFLMQFLCGKEFNCANHSCETCLDYETKLNEMLIPACKEQPVIWTKWITEGSFLQKHQMPGKFVSDVINEFCDIFEKFKLHKYLVYTQHNVLKIMKSELNDSTIILHVDYSENFSIAVQDEVQSAYYKRKQLSIFTAVAFVGQLNTVSFAIVSDDTKHQKEQVSYYIQIIIEMLHSAFVALTHILFVSDGCAAQFKNKYILGNLIHMENDFGLKAEWHFLPTSHGKSCADGIGGTLKRQVSHRMLSGLYNVKNAQDFVECALTFTKNINVIHATFDEMKLETDKLKNRWSNVKPIPNIRSCHFFEPIGSKILAAISSKRDGSKIYDI